MTKSIVLVGVGGQGTILVSKILTAGLLKLGYDVKMSEIHGMSQRGGSVTTMIKYGEKVYAPNIGNGEADMIVSFEKIEAARALPYLKKGGIIVTDDKEIHPMSVLTGAQEYPHDILDELGKEVEGLTVVSAGKIAEELGNTKVSNVVLLGALVKKMGLDQEGIDWKELVGNTVPAKAKEINLVAFEKGYNL